MTRRRIAIAGALLLLAGAIGGYLLGATSAPDAEEALAAERAASLQAFPEAQEDAFTAGEKKGLAAGTSAGRTDGDLTGASIGNTVAEDDITATVLARAEDRRSESEPSGPSARIASLPGDGGVLVVGDSLQELSAPYLDDYLPSVPLTINAVGGYNSFQIFDLFEESFSPDQSVIVFDAGTNDNPNYPEILAGNLQKVSQMVGDRCLVVPTIHGLSVDGVDSSAKNRVVADFAASRPGTQTPDWANAVATHPELMQSDDLHPIAEGAQLRAQIIADGVRACLGRV